MTAAPPQVPLWLMPLWLIQIALVVGLLFVARLNSSLFWVSLVVQSFSVWINGVRLWKAAL